MDDSTIAQIITLVLTIISIYAGARWGQAKAKAQQFGDLLNAVNDAATDDAVSEAEFQRIMAAAKALMDKSNAPAQTTVTVAASPPPTP